MSANPNSSRHLLLSDIFPPTHGGSGRWFWEIYRRLPQRYLAYIVGEHVNAATFDATHDLQLNRIPLGLSDWGTFRPKHFLKYWKLASRIKNVILAKEVGRVHCGRCLPEGWLAWLLKRRVGVPYISYVHGEDVETATTSRELSWMVRKVLAGADFLIANSQNTCEILKSQWNIAEEKIRVLYPGVDTKHFSPAAPSGTVRQKLFWNGRTVILTVGRLQQRKGQDMLIRSLPQIRDVIPNILYCLVGGGEDRTRLEQLAEDLSVRDAVQFLEEIDDTVMRDCYQQCDLFALPNRQVGKDIEGFGMVLLEAQACGKPVLAGRSGGTRETMREGETGLLVDCTSPEILSSAIVEILLNPYGLGKMGEAGRRWVESRFDWDVLARKSADTFGLPLPSDAVETSVHC